jgi:phospholipid/cholesterol/gamma-HCH transport system substrate-binding protein
MRRVLAVGAVLLAAAALAIFATGAGNGGGDYRVRAIFMNAFSAVPGEDVKIAGVKVGKIDSIDLTKDHRAAVVLNIQRSGFKDFRQDAECTIRPQSLIGEKFVECVPTVPRPEGAQLPPPLRKIKNGHGKGQYLLPVDHTSQPVDLDLVNNIMRLPFRERLSIILNELGTGVAGQGATLRQAIRNADPALKETDKVLALLAGQNRVLSQLAVNSDRIMAPLARERRHVAGFIVNANTTAEATAERSSALSRDIAKFPEFLRQLRPTMAGLGAFAGQATPVLTDLGKAAPNINTFFESLGPFSKAAVPAVQSLGKTADVASTALVKSKPLIDELNTFGVAANPLAANLNAFLTSTKSTGGIERLMDFLFYSVASINGYDSHGHYLRADLIVNLCSTYALTNSVDCTAKFQQPAEGSARAVSQPVAAPRGANVAKVLGADRPTATKAPASGAGGSTSLLDYLLGG